MHPLLDKYLCDKFPKLLAERNKPMQETCMCWGFECGDGWFYLIQSLCSAVQHRIDSRLEEIVNYDKYYPGGKGKDGKDAPYPKPEPIEQVVFSQVKEKFGGLRIYYSGGDEFIHGMFSLAESMSYAICEECGTTESVGTTKGWITVTCAKDARHPEHLQPNDDTELQAIWKTIKDEQLPKAPTT
jgi:hypothetical protein